MVRLVRALLGVDRGTWYRRTWYRRTWYRLYDLHNRPLDGRAPDPPQKSGTKKPGLNKGSAGITSVPGLFSELFNVAASRPAQMTTEPSETSLRRGLRQGNGLVNRMAHCGDG